MIGNKVERIEQLLKAMDKADGKEDFIIHRSHALRYLKTELKYRTDNPELVTDDLLSKEEIEMYMKALYGGPPYFKRKSNLEILEVLLAAKNAAAAEAQTAKPE